MRPLEQEVAELRLRVAALEKTLDGLYSRMATGAPSELVVPFELTATLTAGSSAAADLLDVDSGGSLVATTDAVTVYSGVINSFAGVSGDRGWARYWRAGGPRWEIIQLEC